MNLQDLHQCLLSTKPLVSLRTKDQESVIRLTYNPVIGQYDFLVLVEADGVTTLFGGLVNSELLSSVISYGQLLETLSEIILEETGTVWKVLGYSGDLIMSSQQYAGTTITRAYVGTTCLAKLTTKQVDGEIQFLDYSNEFIPVQDNALGANVRRLVEDSVRKVPHITNPAQNAIDDVLKLLNRLTKPIDALFRKSVHDELNITAEDYCRIYPERAYEKLAAFIATSSDVKVVELQWSNVWSESQTLNKVFSTESSGNDLRARSGLEAATLLCYHTIFIVLPKTAVFVSPSFIVGLLRSSVINEGSPEAFWNRYKFIGWEKFKTTLESAVRDIHQDYVNQRTHDARKHPR